MTLLTSVLLIILWSSVINTSIANARRVYSDTSVPIVSDAFTVYSNLNQISPSDSFEIGNMPRIQSQDTVGSCFGCGSATIVQKFFCDSDSDIKNLGVKCNELPRDKMVSQLSLVAWSDTNRDQDNSPTNKIPNQIAGDPDNHTNIKIYDDRTEFSSGANALMNSANMFEFMTESCFPFDQLVSKYGTTDSTLFKSIHAKTNQLYEKMKRSTTEGSSFACNECLEQLNSNFNATFSTEAVSSALEKNSFEEFLYSLIFYKCTPMTLNSDQRPTYHQFPNGKKEIVLKKDVFSKMKEVLSKNKPILLSAICLKFDPKSNSCTFNHDTVVSGYRKVCPTKNFSDKNCKNQVKIHNCWGQDWQKANNDGWLDSEKLIEHLNYGQPNILAGDLSWLE